MTAGGDSAHFSIRLFDIAERTEYYVESNGVRSRALPHRRRQSAVRQEDRSRVSLSRVHRDAVGDRCRTAATSRRRVERRSSCTRRRTMPVKGGRLLIEGKEPTPLTLNGDGTLTAPIQVIANGFYKLELQTRARRVRSRLARLHDRRARRPAADDHVREAGARHEGHCGGRGLHAGAGHRRLRRLERSISCTR